MISKAELEEIKARCEAAEPPPWTDDGIKFSSYIWLGPAKNGNMLAETRAVGRGISLDQEMANKKFIAHARTDIPRLIEAVEEYRKVIDRLFDEVSHQADEVMKLEKQLAEAKAKIAEAE